MRRINIALIALLVGAWSVTTSSQSVLPVPKAAFYDNNGNPCAGCRLYAYVAGTTTPQNTYTDASLATPNANPVILDAAGRATVFLTNTLNYKFTLSTAADVPIWTVDNISGQFFGIVTIAAADTRGLRITRNNAEAGMSISSVGGSGKTYGFASTTGGSLVIRDDADGTPNLTINASDQIVLTATGGVSIPNALSVTGTATLGGVTTINAANARGLVVTQTSADAGLQLSSSGGAGTSYGIVSDTSGLLVIQHDADASPQIVLNGSTNGISMAAPGGLTFSGGPILTNTAQTGFLAFNSADDAAISGSTVDFDTEVYDTTSNFAGDTFTAPATGKYQLCATVRFLPGAAAVDVEITTSNRGYTVGQQPATTEGVASGCVYADMDLSDTALVRVLSGNSTVRGSASPYVTFFSGRLVP